MKPGELNQAVKLLLVLIISSYGLGTSASDVRLKIYPMVNRAQIKERITKYEWGRKYLDQSHKNVDKYVNIHVNDPEWIISRIQMYWKKKYTTPVVIGAHYAYAKGEAPVPTVRYTGGRDWATDYSTPKLEQIKPYMDYRDDEIYLQNNKKPGKPWEWVPNSKTAQQIESINVSIMDKAMESAFIYWLTNDKKYARFSKDIFMKYIEGMYYREAPITEKDHRNSHLLGLTSFEVIHEHIVIPMTLCYDFLYSYLKKSDVDFDMVHSVFQRFADQIIKNGVANNNWNIFQARFVTYLALLLDENAAYTNGKGKEYYINTILNENSIRQTALRDVCNTYDQQTGIWNESCGYAVNVTKDLLEVLFLIDGLDNKNILKDFTIVEKAAWATFEYLLPNNRTTAFGDSGYALLPFSTFESLLSFYRKYGEKQKEEQLTAVLTQQINAGLYERDNSVSLYRLFNYIDELLPVMPDTYSLYSNAFYAPNVNLFIQRNGMNKESGLACVNSGTGYNHHHQNGINMELYGKGFPLGVDPGRGTSYWVSDHTDYYGKAVSHNTVVIDGISSNNSRRLQPGEKSEVHKLLFYYPEINKKDAGKMHKLSYADNQYMEEKTNSMQRRLTGIVRTGENSGYFVDIFRSHKMSGGDKMHDYFYHNLGQSLELFDLDNNKINLQKTEELSSQEGVVKGYDFFTNKRKALFDKDFRGVFNLDIDGQPSVCMDVWMKGYDGRSIYVVDSPKSLKGLKDVLPPSQEDLVIPTLIVRQEGEAWHRPFVAVYEPYMKQDGKSIKNVDFVRLNNKESIAIDVIMTDNSSDLILNNIKKNDLIEIKDKDISFCGIYGVVSVKDKKAGCLFMGEGKKIDYKLYSVRSISGYTTALIKIVEKGLFVDTNNNVEVQVPFEGKTKLHYQDKDGKRMEIEGEIQLVGKEKVVRFVLPKLENTELELS